MLLTTEPSLYPLVFVLETKFPYVSFAVFKVISSCLALLNVGTTGVCPGAHVVILIQANKLLFVCSTDPRNTQRKIVYT